MGDYLIHGGDAFSLQKILGHTSLEMTRKYVNLASEDVKESTGASVLWIIWDSE